MLYADKGARAGNFIIDIIALMIIICVLIILFGLFIRKSVTPILRVSMCWLPWCLCFIILLAILFWKNTWKDTYKDNGGG